VYGRLANRIIRAEEEETVGGREALRARLFTRRPGSSRENRRVNQAQRCTSEMAELGQGRKGENLIDARGTFCQNDLPNRTFTYSK